MTGCAILTGEVTEVGKLTGEVRDKGEVIEIGVVMVTGCPKFMDEVILTGLETLTGLLILMAAATVTGLVRVPDAAIEDVILKGEVSVTDV